MLQIQDAQSNFNMNECWITKHLLAASGGCLIYRNYCLVNTADQRSERFITTPLTDK